MGLQSKGNSASEDDEKSIINENRKRPFDSSSKEPKKRLKTKSLYRQPTVKELNRLQETENLFNSNLFRLQIEEVLQEVKVKEKTVKRLQTWFEDFKKYLNAIPEDITEYDFSETTLSKHLKVKLPVSNTLKNIKCVFKFYRPTNIKIIGAYALGCSINSKLTVDIEVVVPSETYTKNDSINYRYHKKRGAYLAYIASYLSNLAIIEELDFSWLNGCETKPLLNIKPVGKLGSNVSFRINLTCEPDAYKLPRFSPLRNNLREAWLCSQENSEKSNEAGPPTPYYNSSVISDIVASTNHEFLNQTLENGDNLRHAIVLLKIWLRQRNLNVSGYIVSLLVAYLVQTKRVNNIMSSYQIVRNVWIVLKSSEWDKKGITLNKEQDSPPLNEFYQYFPIVFLDRTGYYNICWQMSKGTYYALKRECTLAVEMLDNPNINSFTPLFMTPVQPLTQFDHILRIKNLPKLKEAIIKHASKESRVNFGLDELALVAHTLYSLLEKGLGNRVDLILDNVEADFSWQIKKSPDKAKKENYKENLSFGFIINPEYALNNIEKGPSANLPEAEEFRAFWGDKSELRRFQDGSITETCVWEGDSMIERRSITRQIIDYLLKLKYQILPSDVFHINDQLDSLVSRKQYSSSGADCEESSVTVVQAFDALRRDLRAVTELPLDINAVYGISPVFSYCDPLPALPRAPLRNPWKRGGTCLVRDAQRPDGVASIPEYTPACVAVLELGHSGKWPGDLQAFRCLKAAFNLQISERLNKQYSLPTQAYPGYFDILKYGLVFRLAIAHPKEITLLRREIENGVVKHRDTEETVRLQCDTLLLPRLRGALHGLHSKYPAYGPTVCLLKRWLSAHLLSPPHFPSTVAEILSAAIFVHPEPMSPPSNPFTGFLRVLKLLAHKDWTTEMIVLDFNRDMKREEIIQLERLFSEREMKPALHIVTSYDGDLPGIWSATAPTSQVLARAQTLAKSTQHYIEQSLLHDVKDNILGAFVPSLCGYDVLIYLHPSLVPYSGERVDSRPDRRTLPESYVDDVIPVVEFHPVERYLEELRSGYSEFALFFHDAFGGEVIAVLWKPDINETKEFKIMNVNGLAPVQEDGQTRYKVNTAALVEDFRILGRGIVRDITVNT